MRIIEKKLFDSEYSFRIVFFDKHNYSKAFFLDKLRKKCIYYDYIVVTEKNLKKNFIRQLETLYTKDFFKIDSKYGYFSYGRMIIAYENSEKYKAEKRKKKFNELLK